MGNERIFIRTGTAVETGYEKQDTLDHLLCGSALVLCCHGRNIYIHNPRYQEHADSVYDCAGVSTGALIGLPPSLLEVYGNDIRKVYKANGVPMYLGLASMFLSALLHLMLMSAVIYMAAPIAFDAKLPESPPIYFVSLLIFTAVTLSIGSVLGLLIKNQAKLTMISQDDFSPVYYAVGNHVSRRFTSACFCSCGKCMSCGMGISADGRQGFVFIKSVAFAGDLSGCGSDMRLAAQKRLQAES